MSQFLRKVLEINLVIFDFLFKTFIVCTIPVGILISDGFDKIGDFKIF